MIRNRNQIWGVGIKCLRFLEDHDQHWTSKRTPSFFPQRGDAQRGFDPATLLMCATAIGCTRIWGFPQLGVPQDGWFRRRTPMKSWMIWEYPHCRKPI